MKKLVILPVLIVGLLMPAGTHAQMDCSTHIHTIVTNLTGVCTNLEAGQACFAHERVAVTVEGPPATLSFSQPDDRVGFAGVRNLQTSSFDAFTGAWGVALIRPSAAPSILLMTGSVQLDHRSIGADVLDVSVLTETAPGSQCAEAQPGFTIYVPEGDHLDLTLNGAALSLDGALVTVRQQTPNSMALAVFQGQLSVAEGPLAGAGQTLVAVTDNAGTVVFWSAPRVNSDQETQQAQIVFQALSAMLHADMALSGCAQPTVHVVQRGEWIYSIARQYNVSPQAIVDANALENPGLLYAGQQLIIPCSETQPALVSVPVAAPAPEREVFVCENSPRHRVARGETLYGISRRYGASMDDLVAANHLVSPNVIYEGQELIIPCGVDSGTSAQETEPGQPEGTAAQSPNADEAPPADFCQQDYSSAPPDLQELINTLCNP